MPFYEIDEETFNTLDEETRNKAKAYQPEDVDGLKRKANELLSEKKATEAANAQLEADIASLKADYKTRKVDANDENKLTDALAQLEAVKAEKDALVKANLDSKLQSEAIRIASAINSTDARKQALLAKEIRNRLQYEESGFTVLNDKGQATISSLDDLQAEIKQNFDFLAEGTKASGAGATGGSGRAASKPFKEMNATERALLANSNPAEYARLKAQV